MAAGLNGSANPEGWLAHSAWSINYSSSLAPLIAGQRSQNYFEGEFLGTSKSFSGGNLIARFGGSIEGGNLQSQFGTRELRRNTVDNAGYGGAKFYLGLSSRLPHNLVAASYGLQIGSIGPSSNVDWVKQVGDISYEFWHPLGAHRIVDLESRVNAGGILVPGSIPAAARFFGGNREQFFTSGTDWQIRSAPYIRAIPGILLYRTAEGPGADRFFSSSLTAAYTLRYKPIIPPVLANDSDFQSLLQAQIKAATSIEQNYFVTEDSHYVALAAQLPEVRASLAQLKQSVVSAQTSRPGAFIPEFKACTSAISIATSRANAAAKAQANKQYGDISALLSADSTENRLSRVTAACMSTLGSDIQDSGIAASGQNLDSVREAMEKNFAAIDQGLAAKKAEQDLVFIRRTIHTLFHDLNIYSISPVAVLDVAYIGPGSKNLGGTRYGPGGGIRVGLASSINFTAGYAWNVNGRPGEGHGATFFSLTVRDLFSF